MEYSDISLPGIVSPDESIENFAKLYGNDCRGMMMLMASTLGNPSGLPDKPVMESYNSRSLSNSNHRSPRYGVQASHGSRALRYGVPYNPLPAMDNHRPRYLHHKGYSFPGSSQGSRSISHRSYDDHYRQQVDPQPKTQFRVAEHENQYSCPFPERYAWL